MWDWSSFNNKYLNIKQKKIIDKREALRALMTSFVRAKYKYY